jgi:uncharacterized protein
MLVAIVVDTSALFAFADAASVDHVAMRDFVTHTHETLLVPVTVLPEADYLITTRLGGQVARAMLRSILGWRIAGRTPCTYRPGALLGADGSVHG